MPAELNGQGALTDEEAEAARKAAAEKQAKETK